MQKAVFLESILFVAAASFMVLARAKTGNLGKREFKPKTGNLGKREFSLKFKTGNLGIREFSYYLLFNHSLLEFWMFSFVTSM